jgi:hypothetical protein
MKPLEGHEPDLCFLQAPIKAIESVVCILLKEHAIRRVINFSMQVLERLDRKAGKIY